MFKKTAVLATLLWAVALNMLGAGLAHAVPSFARQTGLECSSCHTVFPQLTPFGRQFKLGGYTLSDTEEGEKKPLPVSAGLQISYTSINKSGMDVDSSKWRIPQVASLYYAGKVAGKLGAFTQVSYEEERQQVSLAMADIRYADETTLGDGPLTYGITLNNMPTLQDAWNSTPAYTFPYEPMAVAPMPAAGLGLDMPISMKVAGLGVYGWWNNSIYAELSGYRSREGGGAMGKIDGVAPYWRLAWERQWDSNSLTIGTYGMNGRVKLNQDMAVMMGDTARYRDIALDAQYQWIAEPHIVTFYTTFIKRRQKYDMPDPMMDDTMRVTDNTNVFRINGGYSYQRKYGLIFGYFSVTGDADANLYPVGEVTGSRTGKPDSNGFIAEINYLPWDHAKFALQYTAYNKFNGAKNDYDGSGRDASDNNTLYLLTNFMF